MNAYDFDDAARSVGFGLIAKPPMTLRTTVGRRARRAIAERNVGSW
jgi:hypothetical protein